MLISKMQTYLRDKRPPKKVEIKKKKKWDLAKLENGFLFYQIFVCGMHFFTKTSPFFKSA
jgi:hypothetical protein